MSDDRIDEAVESGRTLSAALLSLGVVERYPMGGARTWKAFDRDAMDRLHENGIVSDPASKTKPALLTDSPTRAHARSSNASGPPKAPPKG